MSELTVLGLGAMGSALAHASLAGGAQLTVWNRTARRVEALRRNGASIAESAAEAVAASPAVIVCVSDYAATYALLEGADLTGKTLVQLSTGSPSEARAAAAWASARGADYLDGAIFAVPSQIGTPESTIYLSGSERAFRSSQELIARTAGTSTYLGERVGAAAAFDLGILSSLFGALLGFYHGAQVVESEGIGVEALGTAMADVAPAMGQMIRHDGSTIASGSYDNPEASLETCYRAMQLLARQAREAGLEGSFPAFAVARFAAGMSAGHASESPAALVKVLRKSAAGRGAR